MGRGDSRSFLTAAMASTWSRVSSNSKASSNSLLPGGVGRIAVARDHLALGVELQELACHVTHGFLDPGLGPFPARSSQPVQGRVRAIDAAVFLDQVEALDRDVQLGIILIGQEHEFLRSLREIDSFQPLEPADAVIDVDDAIAGLEISEIGNEQARRAPRAFRRRRHLCLIEYIRTRQDAQRRSGKEEAGVQRSHPQQDRAVWATSCAWPDSSPARQRWTGISYSLRMSRTRSARPRLANRKTICSPAAPNFCRSAIRSRMLP